MSTSNPPTSGDINSLFDQLEGGNKQNNVIQKLQAIRLWQLMQQEELKKQQQTQLALLKSQQNAAAIEPDSEDDILAVPILDLQPKNLATILEQSSMSEHPLEKDNVDEEEYEENVEEIDEEDALIHEINGLEFNNLEKFSNQQGERETDNEDFSDCEVDVKETETVAEEIVQVVSQNNDEDDLNELHSDIESSFEKASTKPVAFDDVPVKGGKTFEEILEEQLHKEKVKQTAKKAGASTPKRTFLRKGQGIARFNGPPKKPKIKKKPQPRDTVDHSKSIPVIIKVQEKPAKLPTFDELSSARNTSAVPLSINDSSSPDCQNIASDLKPFEDDVVPKPRVRKTARITRREPMKQLTLKPQVVKSPPPPKCPWLLADDNDDSEDVDKQNESTWSDVEDSTLLLDTTQKDFDQTSNETFEQMEQFCNEHYADVSNMQTLEGNDSVMMKKIEPLPPNKLMMSLFPSLRPGPTKNDKKETTVSQGYDAREKLEKQPRKTLEQNPTVLTQKDDVISEEGGASLPPAVLKNKLEEMEAEIKRFQEETSRLSAVRVQEEKQLKQLKEEFDEFQRQKEDELERLDEYKKSETKKLKKDRKLFEEHVAALKSLPNKQDREYIQELEKRIGELQSEAKVKEQRLTAVTNRLRSQLDVAAEENKTLKEQVKSLEENLSKIEREKEVRKNKKSQVVWKAINDIVDSIPNDENVDMDDYIQSHAVQNKTRKPKPISKQVRNPLVDRNDNHLNENYEVTMHDGKVERRKKDGTLEVSFDNGTQKLVHADGTTQIKFTNGDIKTVLPSGIVKYFYTASGTKHTTHPNGLQVIEFNNKQVERHFPDGSKHISYEDGSSKMMKLDGTEETIFPDGTVMVTSLSGDKTIQFSNGQREVHTAEYKRREYPDGTCKTVFADGRQETKYSSGRLRIKDANGTLIVDKMIST